MVSMFLKTTDRPMKRKRMKRGTMKEMILIKIIILNKAVTQRTVMKELILIKIMTMNKAVI